MAPNGVSGEGRGHHLFIMSGWSIGVMIDRWMAFNAARTRSRSLLQPVAGVCVKAR